MSTAEQTSLHVDSKKPAKGTATKQQPVFEFEEGEVEFLKQFRAYKQEFGSVPSLDQLREWKQLGEEKEKERRAEQQRQEAQAKQAERLATAKGLVALLTPSADSTTKLSEVFDLVSRAQIAFTGDALWFDVYRLAQPPKERRERKAADPNAPKERKERGPSYRVEQSEVKAVEDFMKELRNSSEDFHSLSDITGKGFKLDRYIAKYDDNRPIDPDALNIRLGRTLTMLAEKGILESTGERARKRYRFKLVSH